MADVVDHFDAWLPINKLAEKEPAFTEAALRYHVFQAGERMSSQGVVPGNGLAHAIRRVGRKVVVHHGRFRKWIETGAAE